MTAPLRPERATDTGINRRVAVRMVRHGRQFNPEERDSLLSPLGEAQARAFRLYDRRVRRTGSDIQSEGKSGTMSIEDRADHRRHA